MACRNPLLAAERERNRQELLAATEAKLEEVLTATRRLRQPPEETLSAADTVRQYKRLSPVERAFRSLKSMDLKVRPIHHHLPDRVHAHVLLCMLAYYVEWHMGQAWAPMLFADADPKAGEALRSSVVAPA